MTIPYDERFRIRDPELEDTLRDVGGIIGETLKEMRPNMGFTLFFFDVDDGPAMFWLSSATRDTMIQALYEFIATQHDQRPPAMRPHKGDYLFTDRFEKTWKLTRTEHPDFPFEITLVSQP